MPIGIRVRVPVRLHRGVRCSVRLAVLDAARGAVRDAVPVAVADTVPLALGVGADDAVGVCVPDAVLGTIAHGMAEGMREGGWAIPDSRLKILDLEGVLSLQPCILLGMLSG